MIKYLSLSLKIFIFLTFLQSCNESEEVIPEIEPQKQSSFISECKNAPLNDDNQEEIILSALNENTLLFTHNNSILSCCSDDVRLESYFSNDTIKVNERAIDIHCDCLCFYDFQLEISPLLNQSYDIIVKKNNNEYLSFSFEFNESLNQTIIIN